MVDLAILLGRILFVSLFVSSGLAHLTQTPGMVEYARSRGLPWPRLAVPASGALILAAGLMILLGIWIDLAALLLVGFLLASAILMHAFWTEPDPMVRQQEMIQFQKDLSLAGAALILFALFGSLGDAVGLTITGSLFNL